MAVCGYVVKAETFYGNKLHKKGEIVAASENLAVIYPALFRKPTEEGEAERAKEVVKAYKEAMKKVEKKAANESGFVFKILTETFYNRKLRKAGGTLRSAERLDKVYPKIFELIEVPKEKNAETEDENTSDLAAGADVSGTKATVGITSAPVQDDQQPVAADNSGEDKVPAPVAADNSGEDEVPAPIGKKTKNSAKNKA